MCAYLSDDLKDYYCICDFYFVDVPVFGLIVFIFLISAKNRNIKLDASSAPFHGLQVSSLVILPSSLVSRTFLSLRSFAWGFLSAIMW